MVLCPDDRLTLGVRAPVGLAAPIRLHADVEEELTQSPVSGCGDCPCGYAWWGVEPAVVLPRVPPATPPDTGGGLTTCQHLQGGARLAELLEPSHAGVNGSRPARQTK
jgi:hypothetical protein